MLAATSATVTSLSKLLVLPSGNVMTGMGRN
jgi:hypothetical protein